MAWRLQTKLLCGGGFTFGAVLLLIATLWDFRCALPALAGNERRLTHDNKTSTGVVTDGSLMPIFMMHGINDNAKSEFTNMASWIQEAHPGTATYPIAMYENSPDSWAPLQVQLEQIARYIRKEVSSKPDTFSKGYNLVCHSQGGLLCRTLVQYMNDHKVHTLVSLAGPQMGAYGPAFFDFLKKLPAVRSFTFESVYKIAYTALAQKTLSPANMWNDPMHHDALLSSATFLALYNGLTSDSGNASRKSNFARLQRAVFLTGIPQEGDYDGGIEPACSGIFGYFRDGSRTQTLPMKSQEIYTADTFGLRTLDEAGRLVTEAVPGVGHHAWVDNVDVFRKYILPHLEKL